MTTPSWLSITRGTAPLLLSIPHTGIEIPPALEVQFPSPALARKDADWYVERVYDFAESLGATIVRTAISRSVIDVNRDPSGASLYPGQATTGLCPTESFDGEPLYTADTEPDADEINRRRAAYFDPYHQALADEISRLKALHPHIVLYDCHSIRSEIPRLFDGLLPHINIGTNSGASCAPAAQSVVETACAASRFSHVSNGRFRGGWITRHYGNPASGVHAIQIELACRAYLNETPGPVTLDNWPPAYDPAYAEPLRALLTLMLSNLADWAGAYPRI
jgi:formiminoglutamase